METEFIRGRIVNTNGERWEIRANEFIFPPPPIQAGEVRLVRPLTPDEEARRRYYIDIRATQYVDDPYKYYDFKRDIPKKFITAYRIIFEILGGTLTTPRLKDWQEQRAKSFATDIGHFLNYRPAAKHEADLFLELAGQYWREFRMVQGS